MLFRSRERFLADLATTQAVIARGMLPVTEVKLEAMEKRIENIEKDVEILLQKSRTQLNLEAMK